MGQTRVAGHIGFVLPLVTHSDGATTTIADGFSIGFPTGMTLKGPGRPAGFDMEFVSIQKSPRSCPSPLIPASWKPWAMGSQWGRAQPSRQLYTYGFTPLVNKSWPIEKPGLRNATSSGRPAGPFRSPHRRTRHHPRYLRHALRCRLLGQYMRSSLTRRGWERLSNGRARLYRLRKNWGWTGKTNPRG